MKSKFVNLITLLPVLLGEYILISNYLFFKPQITPSVSQVYGNSSVSGDVFTFIQYGYIVSITFLSLCLVVLTILSWKEKTRALLITTSIISTLALYLVGSLLAISNNIFSPI